MVCSNAHARGVMARNNSYFFRIVLVFVFFASVDSVRAQMNMPGMAAMENSVGYMSSGTSIEPKTTSEIVPMIHTSLRNWTLMFHANGFLVDVQQSGPRGGDKLFST